MMRVLHVIPSVAPRYGGPSTAIAAMSEALNRIAGVTVEVAATDADGPDRYDLKSWAVANTPLHLFPRGNPKSLAKWLDSEVPRYDVVHTHSVWNYPEYAACRTAKRRGKPLVYRPCGMLSDYSWSRRPLLKYAYWLARERGNVLAAAAFHCTSEDEAAEVRQHRAARGKIHVVPNGVDSAAWTVPKDPGELRRRCGPKSDGLPIILFLSRLHPKKGLTEFLLPALSNLKTPAFLAIVGGPDEHAAGYESKIHSTVISLGLTDRVALLGPIPAADRWAMFDGADVFALSSHSENFGIVVGEAMARGCPVLVTNGVQSHEHVSRADAGVVVEPAIESVAKGLSQLLQGDRKAIGERGRTYARDHFDWDRIAVAILELYRDVSKLTP